MTSRNSIKCCRPSWSSARPRPRGAASICVQMPVIEADVPWRSSNRTATSLTSSVAQRKPPPRGATRQRRRGAGWFNRFRKLLVRYEKLERSFAALNHIAAGIIAFRKVKLTVNIIYG